MKVKDILVTSSCTALILFGLIVVALVEEGKLRQRLALEQAQRDITCEEYLGDSLSQTVDKARYDYNMAAARASGVPDAELAVFKAWSAEIDAKRAGKDFRGTRCDGGE